MKKSVHFSTATKANPSADKWETPRVLFEQLHAEFGFTLDAAAEKSTAKCRQYYTAEDDALKQDWKKDSKGGAVWLNPPYSRGLQAAFIRKAHSEATRGCTVVCLIPARPDTKIWQEVILPNAEVRFIAGRVRFFGATAGAPFPSALVIFRSHAGFANCQGATFRQ